ncbi:hypothetical protein INT45_002561 [Circinella minor]|uniref:F-box domain-containing protein n=1 Tax=Circinella minor TaxID=1195481 RepID=A0A8H7RDA4_9FUNG|nr:hypothetical protein INT45_002561 [Circinella minor]
MLKNTSHSLEEACLDHEDLNCNEILDICPNLKRLRFIKRNLGGYPVRAQRQPERQRQVKLQAEPQHSSLTSFYLNTELEYGMQDIETTVQRLINLQEININISSFNLDSLCLVHKYGSKELRHISINARPDQYSYDMESEYDNNSIDTSRYDYTIDVHNCQYVTASLLLQLVNHSVNMKQKIEAISLCPETDSALDDWSAFKYFTSPCLRYIKFSFNKQTEELFANVIRNCPTLEVVNIFRLICSPTNITMDALKMLPVLQSFSIGNWGEEVYRCGPDTRSYSTDINDTVIRDFFTYHTLLDKHSTLQEVRLRYISNLEPETYSTLFKIKSLKSLNFGGLYLTEEQSIYPFINGPEEFLLPSQLEMLVLDDLAEIDDDYISSLDFPTMVLLNMSCLSTAGLIGMVENAKKLKRLIVNRWDDNWVNLHDIPPAELEDCMKRNKIQFN